MTVGEIVVGVDGSPGATAALQWAAREARLRRWTVTAVLAWGFLDGHYPATLLGDELGPQYSDRHARAALDAAVAIALGVDAAQHVRREVAGEVAVDALVERSRGADLLVVGARGLHGFHSLLLGSVSDQCTHLATCPVAVVHATHADARLARLSQPTAEHSERIVVGVDGSPAAQRALRWALDEARIRDAKLDVVHAWQLPFLASATAVATMAADLEDAGRAILDEAIDGQQAEDEPAIQRLLLCGTPAGAILETAQDADLVVLGTQGASGVYGLLMGSVSRQVVHHAPCPVVVTPPGCLDDRDDGASDGISEETRRSRDVEREGRLAPGS